METFEDRFAKAEELVGGRYRLTTLLQKRIRELVRKEPPLVQLETDDYIEIALAEVLQRKVELGAELEEAEELFEAGLPGPDREAGEERSRRSVEL